MLQRFARAINFLRAHILCKKQPTFRAYFSPTSLFKLRFIMNSDYVILNIKNKSWIST